MFDYDPRLLTLLLQPEPKSISDVVQRLESIDAMCIDGDGLKWFNWLYLRITQAVGVKTPALADPAWLAALDLNFASFYFDALTSWLRQQPMSNCWKVVFDRRADARVSRIQFALAGVNAHINHDLSAAIVSTCQVTNTTPDHGGSHYNDYTTLNATLDAQIDGAKAVLNIRLLGDAIPPLSHIEDMIAAWKVTAARENAWLNAGHLWHVRSVPVLGKTFLDTLDGFTAVIGKALLIPVP